MSSGDENRRPHRSVNDFHSAEELVQALKTMSVTSSSSDGQYVSFVDPELEQSQIGACLGTLYEADEGSVGSASETQQNQSLDPELDWVLENFDRETTEPQTLNEELQRLLVLKSYLVLDDERKQSFERITGLASRMFNCPMALVSLVDLGRQWFMSNRGLGETRETSRKYAFCAHVVMSKENFLLVNDATKDVRFQNNPLVTGPPNIRFYAGAPLISPEGYKLGTLCVLDTKPRPDGISLAEKQNLMELAALAVQAAADHRSMKSKQFSDPAQMIAYTAHDLLTPLNGVQLSLSMLMEDEEFKSKLTPQQREMITTASTCTGVMERICESAIDSIRNDPQTITPMSKNGRTPSSIGKEGRDRQESVQCPVVIADFVKTLYMVLDPFPKNVPLLITIHPSVPKSIITNDLKVFRAAVNYLTNACAKTETGSVQLSISAKVRNGRRMLLFECEDTGSGVPVEALGSLFRPVSNSGQISEDEITSNCLRTNAAGVVEPVSQLVMPNLGLGLYSVAVNISSLGGDYGYRPRSIDANDSPSAFPSSGRNNDSRSDQGKCGAVFWFTIPLVEPNASVGGYMNNSLHRSLDSFNSSFRELSEEPLSQSHMVRILSTPSLTEQDANRVYSSFTRLLEGDMSTEALKSPDDATSMNGDRREKYDNRRSQPPREISISTGDACAGGVPDVAAPTTRTAPMKLAVPIEKEGKRIRRALVIEDSLVVRKSLTRVLTKLGFQVVQAVDGMEGLKELKASLFDVVLCDFLMPVMDGLDCVQQYRDWEAEHRPFFRQYIIGISAHAGENDIAKGMEVGMDDFKPKPVTYKQLGDLDRSEELRVVGDKLDEIASAGALMKDTSGGSGVAGESGAVDTATHFCLVASESDTPDSSLVEAVALTKGWKVVKVRDGDDVLRLLKVRNWDAVLLDEGMHQLTPAQCVGRFREWEERNRVTQQLNIGLWSSSCVLPTMGCKSMIQLPYGFDFSLSKPTRADDVACMMTRAERNETDFGIRNFVAR